MEFIKGLGISVKVALLAFLAALAVGIGTLMGYWQKETVLK